MKCHYFLLILLLMPMHLLAQTYTRQDSLRGSNGRGRDWWDVLKYELTIQFDTGQQYISGTNRITFRIVKPPSDSMQIDLQEGMEIPDFTKEAGLDLQRVHYPREGNVYWVVLPDNNWKIGEVYSIYLSFRGRPRIAKNAPWDGGFIRTKDSLGNAWTAVACQGLGASCWWPCKDYQGDKPDSGMQIDFSLRNFSNGLVSNGRDASNGTDTIGVADDLGNIVIARPFFYNVKNPINNYNVTFYIGDYAHWQDTLMGEKGKLDLDFYPLKYNGQRARKQFAVTKQMLHCFEYWMGPYPFYEDGYKLVEAPYLGMEHQSAIAYGNKYIMGHAGNDRSHTGIGMLFDYIIVHESGHEWFGNSITAQDIADNWLHEGFATYTEGLFVECAFGRDSAFQYIRGEWANIRNDRKVIGDYGVNDEGSQDRYDKGSAVVHMIRNTMNNDERFRQLLRGLNKDFYHKIVTTAQVEDYISKAVGKKLQPFFDQYLRTPNIPVLEYYTEGRTLHYRFANVVKGFSLTIPIVTSDQQLKLNVTDEWQALKSKKHFDEIRFSEDFLYKLRYLLEP